MFKRCIGKTNLFPHYYIEIVFDQNRNIVGQLVYERDTARVVSKDEFPRKQRKQLETLTKSSLEILQGEDFTQFLQGRKKIRKELKEHLNQKTKDDNMTVVFADNLYNEGLYASFYGKKVSAYTIFELTEKKGIEFARLNKEELDYASVLFFIKNSISSEKVSMFLMEDKRKNSYVFATYRTHVNGDLYIGFIDDKTNKVYEMKAYNPDFKPLKLSNDAVQVKKLMEDIVEERVSSQR